MIETDRLQRPYFKLPASKAKDQCDHYFMFQARTPLETSQVWISAYQEHRQGEKHIKKS